LARELVDNGPADSQPHARLKEPAVVRFPKLNHPVLGRAADEDNHV